VSRRAGPLDALIKRLPLIVLCAVVAAGAALAVSLRQDKEYTATSTLLFRDQLLDERVFGSDTPDGTDPAREAATNVRLVSLEAVAARTARRLDAGLTPAQVQSKVVVTADGSSDVVTIEAKDGRPEQASRLADAFANSYIAFRRSADRERIDQARALIERQLDELAPEARGGEQGQLLRRSARQLRILSALQTGNAELVQPALTPSSPSSPKPVRNAALGGLLGLLLGAGLALVLSVRDRRIRNVDEMQALVGRPLLGLIPEIRELKKSRRPEELTPPAAEAFRALRLRLRYYDPDHPVKSVLITSPMPGAGKTTVAWYLAHIAASLGDRTLLIQADVHRPDVFARLGSQVEVGLTSVLGGDTTLEEATWTAASDNGSSDSARLDVLTSGPVPPNPQRLFESGRMEQLLRQAEEAYDLVLIDMPPASQVSEVMPLARKVHGVLLVCRLRSTDRDVVLDLREHLDRLEATTLGVVVNGVTRRDGVRPYYGEVYA
jgi:polysaccharide biosynthesis transport protein